MMQEVLTKTNKILVDSKSSNNLLYLPLDKMIEKSNTTATPAAVAPAAPPQAALPEPTNSAARTQRSREAFRIRERESR
jgi:membrane protease subunit HflK